MVVAAGQILTASILNDATEKTKRRGTRDTTSANSTTSTAVGVLRIDNVLLVAGKQYTIKFLAHPNSGTGTDNIRIEARYNIGGTAVTTDPTVRGAVHFAQVIAGPVYWESTFTCGDSGYPGAGIASFLLCFARDSGGGTCNLFCDTSRNIQFRCVRTGDEGDSGTDIP